MLENIPSDVSHALLRLTYDRGSAPLLTGVSELIPFLKAFLHAVRWHANVTVAAAAVMIMILMGALRLQRNFHILSHGPRLVEHGINIFILVPFPLEHDKPSM